jgi:hypothetical protein
MAHRFEGSSSQTITVILNEGGVGADPPGGCPPVILAVPEEASGTAGIVFGLVSFSTGLWIFAGAGLASG